MLSGLRYGGLYLLGPAPRSTWFPLGPASTIFHTGSAPLGSVVCQREKPCSKSSFKISGSVSFAEAILCPPVQYVVTSAKQHKRRCMSVNSKVKVEVLLRRKTVVCDL